MNILKTSITIVSVIAGSLIIPCQFQGQYFTEPFRMMEFKAGSSQETGLAAQVTIKNNRQESKISSKSVHDNLHYKNYPVVILSGCSSCYPADISRSHTRYPARQSGRRTAVTMAVKDLP